MKYQFILTNFTSNTRSSSIFSAIGFLSKCNNVDLDVDEEEVILDFAEVAYGSGVGVIVGDEVAPTGKEVTADGI